MGQSGIPERFQEKTFEQFEATTPQQQRVLQACRTYAERLATSQSRGANLLLLGGLGTGKTHLACATLAHAIRAGRTGLFLSVSGALRMLREIDSPKATRTESDVLALLTEPDVLVIDEIAVGIGKDNKRQAMLFDSLNTRYGALRSTILIGNLTATEMQAYLGERLMDRLHDGDSAVLSLRWPSYRRRHQDQTLDTQGQTQSTGAPSCCQPSKYLLASRPPQRLVGTVPGCPPRDLPPTDRFNDCPGV